MKVAVSRVFESSERAVRADRALIRGKKPIAPVPGMRLSQMTESDDADLGNYQARVVPGPEFESEDETVIATIPPDCPRVFLTAAGLAVPSAAMSYKIYVRLTTGNESGSEAVTVTRPG